MSRSVWSGCPSLRTSNLLGLLLQLLDLILGALAALVSIRLDLSIELAIILIPAPLYPGVRRSVVLDVLRSRCPTRGPPPSVPFHPSASADAPASSSRLHQRGLRCLLHVSPCPLLRPCVDVTEYVDVRRVDSFPTQRAID